MLHDKQSQHLVAYHNKFIAHASGILAALWGWAGCCLGDWVDWAVVHVSHPAAVQRWHDCMAMAEGPEHKRKHARLL